ncbi:Transcription factor [Penicillium brevicompactum]|uniref:Transcription factor n=1 Tax=Penicillium brevicompactum TaxID=5074 RepID=A0A9W9QLQ6_PENBR|nr:Transcription factor [Penicillium brevicompactum]
MDEDIPTSECIRQFSDTENSNELLSSGRSPESIVPEGRLVRLFYENFHSAHPILVPAALYEKSKYPPYLHQVVKFIGSHYSVVLNNDILYDSTWSIIKEIADRTPHMVQVLLLYSIIMRARNNISEAKSSLVQAIAIAIELEMYREDFATTFSGGRKHEAESLRRTWWELFIWEVYMATLYEKSTLQCSDISSEVLLPCEETTYASQIIPKPQSLASFRTRVFTEDEEAGHYSSFAYRIEAVRILARVLVLNVLPEIHHDHLQAVANTLVSWIHHLPPQKIDIVDKYGNIDEMLFQAHFTIQYAAMLLHLPRSNLRPIFPHSMFFICPVTPFRLSPSLTRHVHDVKTIEASKQLSNLLSVRSSAQGSSPLVVFGSLLCGLVQLAATERHGLECYDHHQNRVVLVLGSLKILKDKWSLAQEAHSHLRNTAAQTAMPSTKYSPFESRITPPQATHRPNTAIGGTVFSFPVGDDGIGDRLSSRFLSEFLDPTCGDSFPPFPMPNPESLPGVFDSQLM